MQIGYGSTVSSIDIQNTRSGIQPTDIPTDLYIGGDGYFIVQDGTGDINYTRVGNFKFDSAGNLVDSNGYSVVGQKVTYKVDLNGELILDADGNPEIDEITYEPIKISNASNYSEIAIGKDGQITALNGTEGTMDFLGRVALAKFPNPDALLQQGNSYRKESQNSGVAEYVVPGSNSTGALISGGLEMSNVDLSKEFTDMISAQRGFQANSRVITTSDEILQELVNLKK